MHVPPRRWTRQLQQFGTVGTSYDYAIGALWARDNLSAVFARVKMATASYSPLIRLVFALEELLLVELAAVRRCRLGRTQRDFFRGLGLLGQLDALSRAPVEPPPWTLDLDGRALGRRALRQHLRRHYPDMFVDEMIELLRVTADDLPRAGRAVYDPVFGCPPGLEHIPADGDLIVGRTLFELKVSTQPFGRDHLWQLLGYVALDRLHSRRRIVRVALYNPRFRRLWIEEAERLAVRLGATSLDEFCTWLRDTPEAHTRSVVGRAA